MKITYDQAKNDRNLEERGLSFDLALEMTWNTALIAEDTRKDYGEPRYLVHGKIEERLHVLVFTPRGEVLHIISLRKANREVRHYEQKNRS